MDSRWATGLQGDVRTDTIKFQESPEEKGRVQSFKPMLPSEFVRRLIYIDGRPFDEGGGFGTRQYLLPIVNRNHKRLLLKCARQVEKSTTLGNRLITLHAMIPFFRSLYIAPTETQVRRFSVERLERTLATSPGLKVFHESMALNNVMLKEFPNHSTIALGSVFHTADRIRGIAADALNLDEFQDIISDHIPVIEEVLSHSRPEYRYFWGAGTPKSLDNPIEIYWDRFSTQHEWTVPCESHMPVHWNVLGIKNVGKRSLICDQCGRTIDTRNGKWQMLGNPDAQFHGYRISQLMVPWIAWKDIMSRLQRYSIDKFYNEVLGLSYDSGSRPLSRNDIIKNCHAEIKGDYNSAIAFQRKFRVPLYMGIDWGTGNESFTVVTVLGYHPVIGRLTVLYVKKYIGEEADPIVQLEDIKKLIISMGVEKVGCDWGFGHYQNDVLMREFGRQVVATYMYSAAQQRKVHLDVGLRRFIVNRTAVMSDMFNAIKRGAFYFPRQEGFLDQYGSDFLNIFAEYSERSRMILYNHPVGRPDDCFHSFLYGVLASMLHRPRPDILEPEAGRTG